MYKNYVSIHINIYKMAIAFMSGKINEDLPWLKEKIKPQKIIPLGFDIELWIIKTNEFEPNQPVVVRIDPFNNIKIVSEFIRYRG
jgi:hypothetical protein